MDDEARVLSLDFKKVSEFYSKDADSESGSRVQVSHPFHVGEYLTAIGLDTPKVDYHLTRQMLMGQILRGTGDVTDYPLRPVIENFQFGCGLINNGSLYYVQLLGISVAGIRLNVPSTVFTSKGTVIDSGIVITYLPESIYITLRTNFKQSTAKYPHAAPQEKLDTCYNVKGIIRICLPDIVFHFGSGTDQRELDILYDMDAG
ncbi:hypothetical protein ACH5RR_023905 [Cinchona calisaya]|uniref:Xylanase inhibitor C-terminal domain-containing protein n=1 Tax=Cinchona calisaya TaxID=153742 RepID=A0ABD2ZC25_9GENT